MFDSAVILWVREIQLFRIAVRLQVRRKRHDATPRLVGEGTVVTLILGGRLCTQLDIFIIPYNTFSIRA